MFSIFIGVGNGLWILIAREKWAAIFNHDREVVEMASRIVLEMLSILIAVTCVEFLAPRRWITGSIRRSYARVRVEGELVLLVSILLTTRRSCEYLRILLVGFDLRNSPLLQTWMGIDWYLVRTLSLHIQYVPPSKKY